MKKHVSLTLLLVTALGVLNAHVDLPELDGRRFVHAQARLYDPLGWLQDHWTRLTRRCASAETVAQERAQQALRAIQDFSPPDSHSARLMQLQAAGPWLLAEVEFERLSPAVVLLREAAGRTEVQGQAIWSGSTAPWRPAPLIRSHLANRAPDVPATLVACFTPRAALFQPG